MSLETAKSESGNEITRSSSNLHKDLYRTPDTTTPTTTDTTADRTGTPTAGGSTPVETTTPVPGTRPQGEPESLVFHDPFDPLGDWAAATGQKPLSYDELFSTKIPTGSGGARMRTTQGAEGEMVAMASGSEAPAYQFVSTELPVQSAEQAPRGDVPNGKLAQTQFDTDGILKAVQIAKERNLPIIVYRGADFCHNCPPVHDAVDKFGTELEGKPTSEAVLLKLNWERRNELIKNDPTSELAKTLEKMFPGGSVPAMRIYNPNDLSKPLQVPYGWGGDVNVLRGLVETGKTEMAKYAPKTPPGGQFVQPGQDNKPLQPGQTVPPGQVTDPLAILKRNLPQTAPQTGVPQTRPDAQPTGPMATDILRGIPNLTVPQPEVKVEAKPQERPPEKRTDAVVDGAPVKLDKVDFKTDDILNAIQLAKEKNLPIIIYKGANSCSNCPPVSRAIDGLTKELASKPTTDAIVIKLNYERQAELRQKDPNSEISKALEQVMPWNKSAFPEVRVYNPNDMSKPVPDSNGYGGDIDVLRKMVETGRAAMPKPTPKAEQTPAPRVESAKVEPPKTGPQTEAPPQMRATDLLDPAAVQKAIEELSKPTQQAGSDAKPKVELSEKQKYYLNLNMPSEEIVKKALERSGLTGDPKTIRDQMKAHVESEVANKSLDQAALEKFPRVGAAYVGTGALSAPELKTALDRQAELKREGKPQELSAVLKSLYADKPDRLAQIEKASSFYDAMKAMTPVTPTTAQEANRALADAKKRDVPVVVSAPTLICADGLCTMKEFDARSAAKDMGDQALFMNLPRGGLTDIPAGKEYDELRAINEQFKVTDQDHKEVIDVHVFKPNAKTKALEQQDGKGQKTGPGSGLIEGFSVLPKQKAMTDEPVQAMEFIEARLRELRSAKDK